MGLSNLDIINGTFCIIVAIIFLFVGLRITLKYFKYKEKNFLLVGISGICLGSGWWGGSASFIVALTINENGISYTAMALLNLVPISFALILWLASITNFLYKEKQKIIRYYNNKLREKK